MKWREPLQMIVLKIVGRTQFNWSWFGWTREKRRTTYRMKIFTPVRNVPPWMFPDVRIDFALMEKERGRIKSNIPACLNDGGPMAPPCGQTNTETWPPAEVPSAGGQKRDFIKVCARVYVRTLARACERDVICSFAVLDAEHLSTVRRRNYSGCSVRRDRAAPVPAWSPPPPHPPEQRASAGGVYAFVRSCVRNMASSPVTPASSGGETPSPNGCREPAPARQVPVRART